MFTRIPKLFAPTFVLTDESLLHYEKLATRQQLLISMWCAIVIVVAALSALPVMSGPGPILTYLAQQFPSTFENVYNLAKEPMSGAEALGILVILGLFYGLCCAEWTIMWHVKNQLKPLDATGKELTMFDELAQVKHPTALYLAQVRAVRPVRVGDWKVAHKLSVDMPIPKE